MGRWPTCAPFWGTTHVGFSLFQEKAMHYCKECQGCGKMFRRNRSRKRHILGHEYIQYYKEDAEGNKVPVRKNIPPCPHLGDNYRHEAASFYTLKAVGEESILAKHLAR